ncbi:calcium-binding protein [Streptomyces yaanensis]|uniref:Calcium-binding protein n=1 Tax=Streptomyces yaanensis TaxID=1142239 RepID=A0ABV7S9Y1_9ACTN|nr:calcium-binding protein [Streptomyces sp. CGMCC 4.7035]WNC02586.1 calcium-binding protein [Streptomyces sp. CGMCC 4.7035]
MRIRASVAVVTGALALTAFAVPAAQAADAPGVGALAQSVQQIAGKSPADDSSGDTKISNVVVNGGKAVVFGTTTKRTFAVTFTATDNSGIDWATAVLYHGTDIDHSDNGAVPNEGNRIKCTAAGSTAANCKGTFTIDASVDGRLLNAHAGTWKVWAIAQAKDADYIQKDNAKSFSVQRYSKLTVNASPEPVKKGNTITVTGKLTRANWESGKYAGYGSQPVKLQFKKAGTSTWTTVKTIKTNSTGNLSTTVKASTDGSFRYSFAGTSATSAATATADYVDVR